MRKATIGLLAILTACGSRGSIPEPEPAVSGDAVCQNRAMVEIVNRTGTTLRVFWLPTTPDGLPLESHFVGEAPVGVRRFPIRGAGYATWSAPRGERINRRDVSWRLVCGS